MSEPAARIRTVDGLRGLAALLVVADHAIDQSWGLGPWTEQNHGITIFALLTGFLLSSQFLRARLERRSRPSPVAFLRARAARIYPGYWVALGVAAATVGLNAMGPGDVWRVITLTQTYGTDTPYEGLIPAWSLSLFLSFYIALPIWSWWRSRSDGGERSAGSILRREVAWLAGLLVVAWTVRALSLTDPIADDPAFTLFGRADWFAIGMILTVVVLARARGAVPQALLLPGRRPGIAFAGALGLTVAGGLVPLHLEEVRGQLETAAAALLVSAAVLHGPVLRGPQRVLASRPARALGRWSYGIFLWGYIAEKAIADLFPMITTGPLLLATLAAGIVLGAASWRFVEQPANRLLRRRRAREPSQRPTPPLDSKATPA